MNQAASQAQRSLGGRMVARCELIESGYDLNNDQIMPALQSGRYPEQMRRFFLTSYF